jgi:hypothetical protein
MPLGLLWDPGFSMLPRGGIVIYVSPKWGWAMRVRNSAGRAWLKNVLYSAPANF